MKSPTKFITLRFEVSCNVRPNTLHNQLCRVIYENDSRAGNALDRNVVNIDVVSKPLQGNEPLTVYAQGYDCEVELPVTVQTLTDNAIDQCATLTPQVRRALKRKGVYLRIVR